MLFATLETSTRHIKIKNHDCLLTDTVGFIERLPHHLIQAFRSTLEEVKEADLLLHVVDTSFEDYQMQIETTNEVLKSLGVENTPMIYVYNKIRLFQTVCYLMRNILFSSVQLGFVCFFKKS